MLRNALIAGTLVLAVVTAAAVPAFAGPGLAPDRPVPIRKKAKPPPPSILVHAKPDPRAEQGHDPYVAFALSRARKGVKYRITQVTGPPASTTCASAFTTEWTPTMKGGHVVFDLEPVVSGKYFDFPGYEPCHGSYVLKVERRASSSSQPTVRRVSFTYPSFKLRYLPTRS